MSELQESQGLERKLTSDELRNKLREPHFLPTHEQITKAFINMEEWDEFFFDKKNPVFELWNEEYLNAFSDYFVGRAEEHNASEEKPLVILEIGAGNGRLSHFLRGKLQKKIPKIVKVIATDSGDWGLKSDFPVEQLKHDEAMEKYKPDIVIVSWMPAQDNSKDIRKFDCVEEYILIGETSGGCCGDEWETWGFSWGQENRGENPPYKADGFERQNLDNLSKLQICRTDRPGDYYHSSTVSFKRLKGT
jgi:hypothetical protein